MMRTMKLICSCSHFCTRNCVAMPIGKAASASDREPPKNGVKHMAMNPPASVTVIGR